MPYTTERGVTSYHDRDTPAEFATSRDEDCGRFNDARDLAYEAAGAALDALDNLYNSPIPDMAGEMADIADAMNALLDRVMALTGRAA